MNSSLVRSPSASGHIKSLEETDPKVNRASREVLKTLVHELMDFLSTQFETWVAKIFAVEERLDLLPRQYRRVSNVSSAVDPGVYD